MAKDKSVPLGLGLLGGNAKVYNTIAEMQKDSKLKVGKVVEVLGYYQAGDGTNHKRVIADSDDGSGIQLSNGLWANIVHNGEIRITWLGITKDTLADDNKAIINKVISKVVSLNKLILDTIFKCYEIEITKEIEITGVLDNKSNIYIKNEDDSKNTIIFKTNGGETYLRNFLISGGLNGIYSEELSFNPRLDNIYCYGCALAGINHTPNEKYNQSGYSNSFVFSYMKNVKLTYNKYGILLDHSKVPLRQNWSNANSIEYSNIDHNEIGIYIKSMDRMECWQINNSDLSINCIGADKTDMTIDEYKNKLSTNKYGAIVLENCGGCDIELNSTYIEYAGDICTVGENSNIGNEIKSKGSSIYANTYEYQDIIYLDEGNTNSAIISKNREYAMFNLINCNKTKIICSNCWLTYFNDVIKTTGNGTGNGFSTKNSNTLFSTYDYIDKSKGIFNVGKDTVLLEISKETSINKRPNTTTYIAPYYIPNICEIGDTKLSGSYIQQSSKLIDISNFSNDRRIYEFLGSATGFIDITGECEFIDNIYGYGADRYSSAYIYAMKGAKFIFDTSKSIQNIESRIGSLHIRGVTFKFKGSGTVTVVFNYVEYNNCIFDFSEFTGTLKLQGNKQIFSKGCSFIGDNFTVSSSCILENKDTSNFFWNDFRTTVPDKITSYPQGHGFNLNGVDYVRKGSQWVRASDGATQALSEVMTLDTSYYSRLMEQEGIINDYDSYRLALSEYNKQEEIEFEHSMKAYNDYLTTVTDKGNIMTYEEFEQQYGNNAMMNLSLVERLEEPEIPESVKKFMGKYLGTTPTPKVETKSTPKIFSFDEVDKLNDTLKKL